MPDVIVGTAVLFEEDGVEHLMVLCQCADGKRPWTSIPVCPKGGQKVREHQWEYVVRGDLLDVTPSLNWVGVFHNDGAWSVKFVRFTAESGYRYPNDLFREINGLQGLFTP